jgi:hypothetical protein
MRTLIRLAGIATAALAGFSAQATDFSPLMEATQSTWPQKTHIGVIADYQHSKEEILALARSAGSGCTITVLDVKTRTQAETAGTQLALRAKPDYVVLLSNDPLLREGDPAATRAIRQVANLGIPAVGTSPQAVRQGAVFSMGAQTGLDVMVTDHMIGTVEVILPQKGRYLPTVAQLDHGMAEIVTVGAL